MYYSPILNINDIWCRVEQFYRCRFLTADKPQNIVVNWETLIALKVNKLISANLSTQLLYDPRITVQSDRNGNGIIEAGEGVTSKVQFKEILGVGLSYNF